MNVALPAELEKRVNDSVETGHFASPDEFFKEAAELMLDVCSSPGQPIPVDEHFDSRLETLLQEAQASGEPAEMTDQDWDDVERKGAALIRARKKG